MNIYSDKQEEEPAKVEEIAMLDLRNHAESIVNNIQKGVGYVLTYRGKPVAKMLPIKAEVKGVFAGEDSLGKLIGITSHLTALSNEEMDIAIYG